MAFKISGAAIRNPIPSLVLFAVLMLLGTVAFQSLPITRAPNIDIPVIQVTVTQSGAAPGDLELQVTKRIEDAVASVAGVKHIQSSVTDGVSTTGIEFRLEVGADRALNDVRDAVDEDPRPAAAHDRRAHHPAHRRGSASQHDLCRQRAGPDPGGTVLVRR